jgi:hypothetical protein
LEKAHRWHFLFTIESLPLSRIEATADQAQPATGDNRREEILPNRAPAEQGGGDRQHMA